MNDAICDECGTVHARGYPCPACGPAWMRRSPVLPPPGVLVGALDAREARAEADALRSGATAAPVGCICPAGANLTCQRADCPRQARRSWGGS